MASAVNIATLSPVKLEPYINPRGARTIAMAFSPSQTIARGTVIAQLTANGLGIKYAIAGTQEQQTVTITGTPTGGTFTLTSTRGGVSTTTSAIAYNATAAAVQAALQALSNIGPGNVTVTGGPGPGTPYVATFDFDEDVPQMTATGSFTGGSSPAIAVTTTTAGVATSDGSAVPVGFLVYDIVVDASGNVVIGPSGATADLTRGFERTAEVYWQGTFLESDLTGLDAAAVTALKAREIGVGAQKCIVLE
jgi:hypothetical protein